MNIDEMIVELQKFADANNMNLNINTIMDNMDSGDFISISQAMDNSDNRTIMGILQKYKASTLESKSYIKESKSNISVNELLSLYESTVPYAIHNPLDYLSVNQVVELVKESMGGINIPNSINPANGQQDLKLDPSTANKNKLNDIMANINNPEFKVATPDMNGTNQDIKSVVGIQQGKSPEESLLVLSGDNSSDPKSVDIEQLGNVSTISEEEDEIVEPQNNVVHNEKTKVAQANDGMSEVIDTIRYFCNYR